MSGTVHVAVDGDDRASGDSWVTAKASLTAAVTALPVGGVVEIGAGTFPPVAPTVVDRPVRFAGRGKGVTVLAVRGWNGVLSAHADDVTVEGVTFRADGEGWLLQTQLKPGTYAGWRFLECEFDQVGLNLSRARRPLGDGSTESTGTGVAVNPVVRGCGFHGFTASHSLYLAGTVGAVIDGNHLHDLGGYRGSEGIKVLHAAHGTMITSNLIERVARDGVDAYNSIATTLIGNTILDPGVGGIEVKWATDDTVLTRHTIVQGNRVERAGATGFNVDAPDTICTGNVALDCGADGFRFAANANGGTVGTRGGQFLANQAIGCGRSGFTVGLLAGEVMLMGNLARDNRVYGFAGRAVSRELNAASGNGAADYQP